MRQNTIKSHYLHLVIRNSEDVNKNILRSESSGAAAKDRKSDIGSLPAGGNSEKCAIGGRHEETNFD